MRTIRKFIWITIAIHILTSINSYSQEKCNTAIISHRIDSICKANKVEFCQVNYYDNYNQSEIRRGKLRLDDCFLIIDDNYYYDLSKLLDFQIGMTNRTISDDRRKALIISFLR